MTHAEEALAKTYGPYRRDGYLIVDWVQFWLASGAFDRATQWAQELTQQARVPSPWPMNVNDTRYWIGSKSDFIVRALTL